MCQDDRDVVDPDSAAILCSSRRGIWPSWGIFGMVTYGGLSACLLVGS